MNKWELIMDYQKAYYELLAKFGEWELVSPTEFDKLMKMQIEEFTAFNCQTAFTAGGGRNICNLIAIKLSEQTAKK